MYSNWLCLYSLYFSFLVSVHCAYSLWQNVSVSAGFIEANIDQKVTNSFRRMCVMPAQKSWWSWLDRDSAAPLRSAMLGLLSSPLPKSLYISTHMCDYLVTYVILMLHLWFSFDKVYGAAWALRFSWSTDLGEGGGYLVWSHQPFWWPLQGGWASLSLF